MLVLASADDFHTEQAVNGLPDTLAAAVLLRDTTTSLAPHVTWYLFGFTPR